MNTGTMTLPLKELSVQIYENGNRITVTEDAVLDQPLEKENMTN